MGGVPSANVSLTYDFEYNSKESYKYEAKNSVGNSHGLSTPFGPLHYMVASAGLSLVLFLIYVIYQQVKITQNQPEPLPEITTCEHRSCARVQLSHPSCRCLSEMCAVNTTLTRSSSNLRTLENSIIAEYSSAYSLDLPPSYINLVRYDCPPSYEEAVTFHANVSQESVHI